MIISFSSSRKIGLIHGESALQTVADMLGLAFVRYYILCSLALRPCINNIVAEYSYLGFLLRPSDDDDDEVYYRSFSG